VKEGIDAVGFARAAVGAKGRERPPSAPRDRAFYLSVLGRWDTAVALLSFVVAVATGFRDLYLDKPFGTAKDYVSLALVGVTTRLALDLLGAAIDRFAVRRSP
jgi:hypothetical protein